jgi:hypothetical protein
MPYPNLNCPHCGKPLTHLVNYCSEKLLDTDKARARPGKRWMETETMYADDGAEMATPDLDYCRRGKIHQIFTCFECGECCS